MRLKPRVLRLNLRKNIITDTQSELKQFMFRYTYYNNLRKWTDTEIALNYLTTELTDEICRAKSANEILSCKAFTNAWTMIGANVADRKILRKPMLLIYCGICKVGFSFGKF